MLIAAAPNLFAPYVSYLRDLGHLVCMAADGSDACLQARVRCPDLVLVDLGPSSALRLTMLHKLKADDCLGAVPLVMLATFDSLDDIKLGLELGARDYVITMETTACALARRIPAWAALDRNLKARD